MKSYVKDEDGTKKLAQKLSKLCHAGDILCLYGDLGAGKTTFARFFLQALGITTEIPSPTFTLVQSYDTNPAPVWHFDLYRLTSQDELEELGIDEAFGKAISLIEWPDRLGQYTPQDRLEITFDFCHNRQERLITLEGKGAWLKRLKNITEKSGINS